MAYFRGDLNSYVNLVSLVILGLSGIAINFLITDIAGESSLGIFSLAFSIYLILSHFAVFGLQYSTLYYCSNGDAPISRCSTIVISTYPLNAPTAGACIIVVHLFSQVFDAVFSNPDVAAGIEIASLALPAFAINKVHLAALNGHRKMREVALLQAIRALLLLGSIGYLLAIKTVPENLLYALVIAELGVLSLSSGILITHGLRVKYEGIVHWIKQNLSCAKASFMGGLLQETNVRVDIIMLGIFMEDAMVGVYTFASSVAEGIAQINYIIRQNVDPIIGRCITRKKTALLRRVISRVRRGYLPLSLILCNGCIVVFWFLVYILDNKEATNSYIGGTYSDPP